MTSNEEPRRVNKSENKKTQPGKKYAEKKQVKAKTSSDAPGDKRRTDNEEGYEGNWLATLPLVDPSSTFSKRIEGGDAAQDNEKPVEAQPSSGAPEDKKKIDNQEGYEGNWLATLPLVDPSSTFSKGIEGGDAAQDNEKPVEAQPSSGAPEDKKKVDNEEGYEGNWLATLPLVDPSNGSLSRTVEDETKTTENTDELIGAAHTQVDNNERESTSANKTPNGGTTASGENPIIEVHGYLKVLAIRGETEEWLKDTGMIRPLQPLKSVQGSTSSRRGLRGAPHTGTPVLGVHRETQSSAKEPHKPEPQGPTATTRLTKKPGGGDTRTPTGSGFAKGYARSKYETVPRVKGKDATAKRVMTKTPSTAKLSGEGQEQPSRGRPVSPPVKQEIKERTGSPKGLGTVLTPVSHGEQEESKLIKETLTKEKLEPKPKHEEMTVIRRFHSDHDDSLITWKIPKIKLIRRLKTTKSEELQRTAKAPSVKKDASFKKAERRNTEPEEQSLASLLAELGLDTEDESEPPVMRRQTLTKPKSATLGQKLASQKAPATNVTQKNKQVTQEVKAKPVPRSPLPTGKTPLKKKESTTLTGVRPSFPPSKQKTGSVKSRQNPKQSEQQTRTLKKQDQQRGKEEQKQQPPDLEQPTQSRGSTEAVTKKQSEEEPRAQEQSLPLSAPKTKSNGNAILTQKSGVAKQTPVSEIQVKEQGEAAVEEKPGADNITKQQASVSETPVKDENVKTFTQDLELGHVEHQASPRKSPVKDEDEEKFVQEPNVEHSKQQVPVSEVAITQQDKNAREQKELEQLKRQESAPKTPPEKLSEKPVVLKPDVKHFEQQASVQNVSAKKQSEKVSSQEQDLIQLQPPTLEPERRTEKQPEVGSFEQEARVLTAGETQKKNEREDQTEDERGQPSDIEKPEDETGNVQRSEMTAESMKYEGHRPAQQKKYDSDTERSKKASRSPSTERTKPPSQNVGSVQATTVRKQNAVANAGAAKSSVATSRKPQTSVQPDARTGSESELQTKLQVSPKKSKTSFMGKSMAKPRVPQTARMPTTDNQKLQREKSVPLTKAKPGAAKQRETARDLPKSKVVHPTADSDIDLKKLVKGKPSAALPSAAKESPKIPKVLPSDTEFGKLSSKEEIPEVSKDAAGHQATALKSRDSFESLRGIKGVMSKTKPKAIGKKKEKVVPLESRKTLETKPTVSTEITGGKRKEADTRKPMPGEVSTRPNFVASASGSEKAALKKPSTKLNKDPSGAKGERKADIGATPSLSVTSKHAESSETPQKKGSNVSLGTFSVAQTPERRKTRPETRRPSVAIPRTPTLPVRSAYNGPKKAAPKAPKTAPSKKASFDLIHDMNVFEASDNKDLRNAGTEDKMSTKSGILEKQSLRTSENLRRSSSSLTGGILTSQKSMLLKKSGSVLEEETKAGAEAPDERPTTKPRKKKKKPSEKKVSASDEVQDKGKKDTDKQMTTRKPKRKSSLLQKAEAQLPMIAAQADEERLHPDAVASKDISKKGPSSSVIQKKTTGDIESISKATGSEDLDLEAPVALLPGLRQDTRSSSLSPYDISGRPAVETKEQKERQQITRESSKDEIRRSKATAHQLEGGKKAGTPKLKSDAPVKAEPLRNDASLTTVAKASLGKTARNKAAPAVAFGMPNAAGPPTKDVSAQQRLARTGATKAVARQKGLSMPSSKDAFGRKEPATPRRTSLLSKEPSQKALAKDPKLPTLKAVRRTSAGQPVGVRRIIRSEKGSSSARGSGVLSQPLEDKLQQKMYTSRAGSEEDVLTLSSLRSQEPSAREAALRCRSDSALMRLQFGRKREKERRHTSLMTIGEVRDPLWSGQKRVAKSGSLIHPERSLSFATRITRSGSSLLQGLSDTKKSRVSKRGYSTRLKGARRVSSVHPELDPASKTSSFSQRPSTTLQKTSSGGYIGKLRSTTGGTKRKDLAGTTGTLSRPQRRPSGARGESGEGFEVVEPLREAQRKLGGGYVPHPRTSMERRKRGSPTAKTPPSSIIAEQKQVDEKKDALLPETSREWYPQQEVSINGQAFNLRFGEQRAHQFVEGVTEGNVFLYSPYTKMYQYPAAFRDGFFSSIAPLASTAAEHEMPIITGVPDPYSYAAGTSAASAATAEATVGRPRDSRNYPTGTQFSDKPRELQSLRLNLSESEALKAKIQNITLPENQCATDLKVEVPETWLRRQKELSSPSTKLCACTLCGDNFRKEKTQPKYHESTTFFQKYFQYGLCRLCSQQYSGSTTGRTDDRPTHRAQLPPDTNGATITYVADEPLQITAHYALDPPMPSKEEMLWLKQHPSSELEKHPQYSQFKWYFDKQRKKMEDMERVEAIRREAKWKTAPSPFV